MSIRKRTELEAQVPVDVAQVLAEFKRAAELNQQMLAMGRLIPILEELVADFKARQTPVFTTTSELGSASSITTSTEAPVTTSEPNAEAKTTAPKKTVKDKPGETTHTAV